MSVRHPFSAFPALHGHARSSLRLPRDICCGMVEAKEGGRWRRHPDISLGFLFFPSCPWFVLSFPGGTWAGDSPKGVFSAEGLSVGYGLAVSASCHLGRHHERSSYIFTWHKLCDVKIELLPCMYVMLSCWIVFCLKYIFLSVEHF